MSQGPLYVLLGEVSLQVCPVSAHSYIGWFFFLQCSCVSSLYILDVILVQGFISKLVFPDSSFCFHFNAVFLSHAEAFYFDEVAFVYSFLYVPQCREHIGESIAMSILCSRPLCQILIDHRDLGLFLETLFCSIDLCVCSYVSTRHFRLPWPCNRV